MWQLDGTLANLKTSAWSGTMDLKQPQFGLHVLNIAVSGFRGEAPDVRLFGLSLPGASSSEEIRDCWIRGTDLVVVYSANSRRATQPEIYWRFLTSQNAVGVELIVSMQTGLLDDHPQTRIVSDLPMTETQWIPSNVPTDTCGNARGPGTTIVRLPGRISYLEMIHPTDFCGAEVTRRESRLALNSPLFPERLEKGVIRRGRIRGWFVPATDDSATADRLFREFAQSDPPLTT